jgi:hypothetical protein
LRRELARVAERLDLFGGALQYKGGFASFLSINAGIAAISTVLLTRGIP